jgi:hypothetical protein
VIKKGYSPSYFEVCIVPQRIMKKRRLANNDIITLHTPNGFRYHHSLL